MNLRKEMDIESKKILNDALVLIALNVSRDYRVVIKRNKIVIKFLEVKK